MWFYILKMFANLSWNGKSWRTKARRRKISPYRGMPQPNVGTHTNKSRKAILNGGVLSARQCIFAFDMMDKLWGEKKKSVY